MSAWLTRVCIAAWVVGCGAKPEAKAPPPASVEPAAQVVEEPPDLSPVARPPEVVAVGRLARPRVFVETLAKWSSVPLGVEDLVPSPMSGAARAVLWEAPIELVVALDTFGEGRLPPPLFVASVGLKSLEAGLSAAEAMQLPTRRLAPGVFRVGDFPDGSCAMAASAGAAPARLVCGRAKKDVDALLPYATRGLPAEAQTGADVELTLEMKPLQDRYGGQISALRLLVSVAMREIALDTPRFDRALSDAMYGGADELINLFGDLELLRLQGRLDPSRSSLLGSVELRLKGDSSWTAGTIAASKPVDVPATLPRLPPGTSFARYSAPMPAERYAAIGRILGELVEGYLEHEKLPPATRKRTRRAIEPWFAQFPESFGFAVPSDKSVSAGGAQLPPETGVTRITEPSARVLAIYNDLLAILNDPAFKRWALNKTELEAKAWPKLTKKQLKLPGFKTPATAFEASVDFRTWAAAGPAVGRALENLFPNAARDQLGRFTIVVQPDGPHTYLATGEDTAEIARVMAEHRKSEPGVFFAKPPRADGVTAVGFFTLAYLARSFERSANLPELRRGMAAAPHRGETPIPYSAGTTPGSVRFDIELPAAAFADASAAAAAAGSSVKDALEKRRGADPLR